MQGGSIEGKFRYRKPVGKIKLTYAGSGRTAGIDLDTGVVKKTEPSPAANAGFNKRDEDRSWVR